jgi:hypothetical protein
MGFQNCNQPGPMSGVFSPLLSFPRNHTGRTPCIRTEKTLIMRVVGLENSSSIRLMESCPASTTMAHNRDVAGTLKRLHDTLMLAQHLKSRVKKVDSEVHMAYLGQGGRDNGCWCVLRYKYLSDVAHFSSSTSQYCFHKSKTTSRPDDVSRELGVFQTNAWNDTCVSVRASPSAGFSKIRCA